MPGTRIFVGGLRNPRLREKDLEKFFEGYGRLDDIVIKQGYGFVVFDDERDAKDAVEECDGKSIQGDRITVEYARGGGGGGGSRGRFGDRGGGDRRGGDRFGDRGRFGGRDGGRDGGFRGRDGGRGGRAPNRRTDFRLIVDNLSTGVSWQDLKDFMRKAGEVNYADAHKQKQNQGVIEFVTRDGMEKALEELDGEELNGRKIKLSKDKGNGRSRSRSRSDSRSRSRSRSRSSSRSKSRSKTPPRRSSKDGARGDAREDAKQDAKQDAKDDQRR